MADFLAFLASFNPMFRDDELCLVLSNEVVADRQLGIVDGYTFHIYPRHRRQVAGYVSLRIGESPSLYYLGHIGYRIEEAYRGRGYAAHACGMLVPLLRQLEINSLCITANPDNLPSRKTCEKLGCQLESIVPVPRAFYSVCPDATHKCRYIWEIPPRQA